VTAGTRVPATAAGTGPVPTARRYRVRRLQGPAWLDGPMISCHLVLGAAGLLLAIGLVMVFSASSIEAALADEPAWAPGVKQTALAGFGLLLLWAGLRLPVGFVRRWAPMALLVSAGLLVLVLVPGIGVKLNGARQWFNLGVTNLQPSEVAKLVFALWGAHIIAIREKYLTTKALLVPVVPVFLALSLLLLLEPDFGGVVSLGLVLIGLLWAGGARWKVWVTFIGLAVGGIVVAVLAAPYRLARITAFLHPFDDPSDGGFQAIRGFYALARGGLWGVGLGNSAMKWDLLPHAESDYIFAIIGEELGFLGCLVVVSLYGVLAYAGFRIARRSADRFIQLASVAITVWLIGQATMNMGYVVGLLPVTGVQLPLISAGGSSLVLTLFIVGLLARFALAEPAAIEHQRRRERGRLARLLVPVPAAAVDPIRPRRSRPARDESGALRREGRGQPAPRRAPVAGGRRPTPVPPDAVPVRLGGPRPRPGTDGRGRGGPVPTPSARRPGRPR
jgi:cell division protein FtsW